MVWANFNIMKSGRVDMTLSNLSSDTRTSVKLLFLIEQLLNTPSGLPFNRNPSQMWHAMQNASMMLRYLSSQTFEKIDGVRAADIVLGNVGATCRLLSYLRDKFDLDFMFKGLLGDDIDAAALGDIDDDVVEIELEDGEAVPEYLRTFIAAEDLAEIDEANRRAAQSPRNLVDPTASSSSHPHKEPVHVEAPPTKQVDVKPVGIKPAEVQPAEVKSDIKPHPEPKPEAKPTHVEPKLIVEPKSPFAVATKAVDVPAKPADKPVVEPTKPAQTDSPSRPVVAQPVEVKPAVVVDPKKPETDTVKPVQDKPVASDPHKHETPPKVPPRRESVGNSPLHKPEDTTTKPSTSPRRPSSPATPVSVLHTQDDTKSPSHLGVPSTSPRTHTDDQPARPRANSKPAKPDVVDASPGKPEVAKPIQQAVEPPRDKSPAKIERTATPDRIRPVGLEPAPASPATTTDPAVADPNRTPSPSKTKGKTKSEAKLLPLALSRPRSVKNAPLPEPINSPRAGARKVRVYKNKVIAEAQSQPATRDRSGSVALSAEQQQRVIDAQTTVRMRVAQELLSTERSYAASLRILVSGFIDRARKESILSSGEISQCFSNIEEISATSSRLETELVQAIEVGKNTNGLPVLFKKFIPAMHQAYEPFISNYNNCMVALQILRLKNPKLVTLQTSFEEELMKTSTNGSSAPVASLFTYPPNAAMYNVESFVIMPVQRIPRYLLLLRDILKYTPKESKQAAELAAAIEEIDQMLKDLNSKIDRDQVEHLRRQLMIAQSIEQAIDIFSVKRRYVAEATLAVKRFKIVDSKKVDDNKKRKSNMKKVDYFFFMSDILLMCAHLNAKSEDQKQFSHVETLPASAFVIAPSEASLASAGLNAKTVFKSEKKHKDSQFVLIRLVENSPVEWWLVESRSPIEREALLRILEGTITIGPN